LIGSRANQQDAMFAAGIAEDDVPAVNTRLIGQGSPTHRRTRLAPAHLDPEGVRRGVRRSKVSTPLNIGAREVELACDEANGTRVDKPEPLLEGVQHRQQWSAYRRVARIVARATSWD